MARKPTGKETKTERAERETIQEFGSLVCPSLAQTSVIAYRKLNGSSRYSVLVSDGSKHECSGAQLRELLREDLALEAL